MVRSTSVIYVCRYDGYTLVFTHQAKQAALRAGHAPDEGVFAFTDEQSSSDSRRYQSSRAGSSQKLHGILLHAKRSGVVVNQEDDGALPTHRESARLERPTLAQLREVFGGTFPETLLDRRVTARQRTSA